MPYILGNEICEKIATVGLSANLMVYLVREYHMEQAKAAVVLNVWYGFTNFLPVVGAFISDAYIGRFKTIVVAAFAQLLGMLIVTLTAWLPNLRPPSCQNDEVCTGPTTPQLAVLAMGLCLLSVGTGGIRPCSIPFGVDQFDSRTKEGAKGQLEFFNKEFPNNMASMATALFSLSFMAANYLSSVLISVIRKWTGAGRRPDWLTNDLNRGRLDFFYFLLAGIGLFNFLYFLYCARKYRYKVPVVGLEEENVDRPEASSFHADVEISLA
ncbi:Protein NRT1/ PTR FAMILY 2.13 [Linum perenne]